MACRRPSAHNVERNPNVCCQWIHAVENETNVTTSLHALKAAEWGLELIANC